MWIQFLWKFKRMSYCVVFIIYGNFIFLFHILLSSLNVCVHRSTGCSVHKYILVSVWVVIKLSGGMTMPLLFCIKRLKNEWKHIKKNAIQKKKQDEIFFCIRNVLNLFTTGWNSTHCYKNTCKVKGWFKYGKIFSIKNCILFDQNLLIVGNSKTLFQNFASNTQLQIELSNCSNNVKNYVS